MDIRDKGIIFTGYLISQPRAKACLEHVIVLTIHIKVYGAAVIFGIAVHMQMRVLHGPQRSECDIIIFECVSAFHISGILLTAIVRCWRTIEAAERDIPCGIILVIRKRQNAINVISIVRIASINTALIIIGGSPGAVILCPYIIPSVAGVKSADKIIYDGHIITHGRSPYIGIVTVA